MLLKKNKTTLGMSFYQRALATLRRAPHRIEIVSSCCEYQNNYGYEAAYIPVVEKKKGKTHAKP